MTIDYGRLAVDMSAAFLKSLGRDYPIVRDYAEAEFRHLADWVKMLIQQSKEGKISEAQAKVLVQIQALSILNVFLTIDGLNRLAVEAAINAAMEVARAAINSALKFALL